MYKKTENESWLKVPVNRNKVKVLKIILKQEGKTLKEFVDEQIQNYLTRVTLIQ